MKALSVFLLVATCVLWDCLGVEIRDRERSYPLEAVKVLKQLMDPDARLNPSLAQTSADAVCANPVLPQAFLPVCRGKGAAVVFNRLVDVLSAGPDPCEICANPSCFGCL